MSKKQFSVQVVHKSFRQRFMDSKVTDFQEELLDATEAWHTGCWEEPLIKFLGFQDYDEIKLLVTDPELLELFLTEKRDGSSTRNS